MVKIWRVENEDGIGCYREGYIPFIGRMIERHTQNQTVTPCPEYDIGIGRGLEKGEICGFMDKLQALNWFTRYDLKNLEVLGFELKEVKVTYITARGQRQVLAVR